MSGQEGGFRSPPSDLRTLRMSFLVEDRGLRFDLWGPEITMAPLGTVPIRVDR